ncbi:Tartrate-resistant acid phosphatase type 5 [Symbiodinium microadriaticum]|uniref:Tartrate-resistant acid phosphatase type 5 n=1 Tax=Symbiodinium microadriaticum TaxID=2951 RepID=A0A1Q9DBF5_SYMMI|nr:Tartrate-resistant acid phosphatase type 5 [Symbiodinium microadriaticum]CAE7249231.1 ACP5 [Symbiodinium sp. KB8]
MAFAKKLAFGLALSIRLGQSTEGWDQKSLAHDDECDRDSEECAVSELQLGARAKAIQNASQHLMGPPITPFQYNGIEWPALKVGKSGPAHFFAIGDWGGMDGALHPPNECMPHGHTPGCRPRIIAYRGGQTPGPHVFPRTRWNKAHSELLCSHDQFVACFDGGEHKGEHCVPGCGFVPGVDTQPQILVANAFRARAGLVNPDFILNVGDNFYWGGIEENCGASMHGITSTTRHQFDSIFEGVYQGGGLSNKPWISVLGNHDWGGRQFNNGWDQQIAYTWASNRWIMPAPYYSMRIEYSGFSIDVFAIDSNAMDAKSPEEDPEHNMCGRKHNPPGATCASIGGPANVDSCHQWFMEFWGKNKAWALQKVPQSNADWQIGLTHFPCGHESGFYAQLHGMGMDLLVTGHRHDQELHDHSGPGGMTCIVTGGGGGITSEATPNPMDRTHWYGEGQYGFYDFTVDKSKIYIESINYDGKVLKTATVYPSR